MPEIAPPEVRQIRAPVVDDVRQLIIEEGCGLRPTRHGSNRLESVEVESRAGRKASVVFNYGYVSLWLLIYDTDSR